MKTQTVEHKVSISKAIENAPIASKMVTEEEPLVLIDVTEKNHFRPKNNSKQKKYYSGKKKRHTVKNTLISDTKRRVIFLGRTFKGNS
ncbi:MAG: hypothetical protein DRQ41_15735 [Gammaproteobacteria bacterium]|nr:MAG: hypothetical protein DRQ41_15735 [Gammaproteobacteria bacterium]